MNPSPSSDAVAARAEIVRVALAAGASAVRFTSARADEPTARRIAASIARGDLATWPYDDAFAARAADPRQLLDGARTVVCLAVTYAGAARRPPRRARPPASGRVSIYARGDDYHARVREIARTVATAIEALADGARAIVACDTAPIAERAFAARAGLGWIGKHTNLIAPGLGSYVYLGEIVTTLELAPDAPLATHCGSCARCVTACPTGALRGDYSMDATLCISDLTQRKEAIPQALRPLIGTWVWGCDLCQEACPPTRLARARMPGAALNAATDEAPAEPDLDLEALLGLRSGDFKRRFRPTAMGWRGGTILRRNAAVALGNALDRASVPALARACASDPQPTVRAHAAWALGRIGSPRAHAALAACAASERDAEVLREIADARRSHLPTAAGKPGGPAAR